MRRGRQHLGESAQTHFWLLVPISVSQHVLLLAHGLGCTRSAPQGVTILEDAVRREANHAYNEQLQAQRQRRRAWSAA
jgi:hypothetical protein